MSVYWQEQRFHKINVLQTGFWKAEIEKLREFRTFAFS